MKSSPSNVIRFHSAGVRFDGVLGRSLEGNRDHHLATFIQNQDSPCIRLFCPDHRDHNEQGDWYGEHAGKWLCATAKCVERTGDSALAANLRSVAEYLISVQEPDGYLGTYAPQRRFVCRRQDRSDAWDGASPQRTWDVWVECYMILGLLEAGRVLAHPGCTAAAGKIGDLCCQAFLEQKFDITTLGNHHGLSATVLLEAAVELYRVSGEARYLQLAEVILQQATENPRLRFMPQVLAEIDAAHIATGKAYQLIWMLVGLVKFYKATGDAQYLQGARQVWENIRAHHLTLGGGPWGGVAHRSREVFNPKPVFSPYGYVETCSIFSWIQLNRELLSLTGDAVYADEIEKSAYNDLLGAQTPSGDNWCYYSFPNGKRVYTTYWRCCKSSGPWAIEEVAASAYGVSRSGGVVINLYGSSSAAVLVKEVGHVQLTQITSYPFDGRITLKVNPERAGTFDVLVRIPAWASQTSVAVNGQRLQGAIVPGTYQTIHRLWSPGDEVVLDFPMTAQWHRKTHRNVQESKAPDGSPVEQEVLHFDYAAMTRGPLVYSTSLIDGFKIEETMRLDAKDASATIETLSAKSPAGAPILQLNLGYRPALSFVPYFEAGGRDDGTWRLTWLQLAPA